MWLSKQINNCTQNNSQNPKRKFFKTFIFLDPVTRSKWVNFDPPLPNSISPTVSSTNFSKGSQPFLMLYSHKILSVFNFWNRHSERVFFLTTKSIKHSHRFLLALKESKHLSLGKNLSCELFMKQDLKIWSKRVEMCEVIVENCFSCIVRIQCAHKTQNRPSPHSSLSLQSSHFQTIGLVNTIKNKL